MFDETDIGGPDGRFPATRWSVVVRARSDDQAEREQALQSLVTVYWKPVYKYLRIRWRHSNEDAKDLTQEFFARLIEKDFLDGYNPERARLRTYLRVCLDRLVQNEARAATRQKRGGDTKIVPLDFATAESELQFAEPAAPESMDEYFEKEWIRSLFSLSIDTLEEDCRSRDREVDFRLFESYDLAEEPDARPKYRQLAERFELSEATVTNRLASVRRRFRSIVLAHLRQLSGSEAEFDREARTLLGWRAK